MERKAKQMETNEHKIIFDHAIDLEKIAASGQCFRWKKLGDGCFGIPSAGAYTRARQINPFVIAITDTAYAAYWENYFDQAGRLYNKALSQAEKMDQAGDQFIKKILEAAAQEVVVLNQELWEIMVSFMISQNNNIPRIKKTIDAMCEYFGERRTAANGDEYTTFPDPEKLTDLEALQGLGLGYRDKYIATLAQNVASGKVNLIKLAAMDYADARTYLKSIYGIGDKVADCICLYGLGHKESFPIDTWIRKVVANEYGGKFPVENYTGTAGIVQQWIFYYMQTRRCEEHGARENN